LLLVLVVRCWRRPVVRVGAVMTLLAAVFSMGAHLHVRGQATTVDLPWSPIRPPACDRQPHPDPVGDVHGAFRRAAARGVPGGGLEGRRLAAAGRGRGGGGDPGPAATGQAGPGPEGRTRRRSSPPAPRRLPEGNVALLLPFANRRIASAMTWQAESGMWFRMPGGYVIVPTPDGRPRYDTDPNSATRAFSRIQGGLPAPKLTFGERRALATNLAGWGVDVVVVGPLMHQGTMLRFLTDLLGRRPTPVDGSTSGATPWSTCRRGHGPDGPESVGPPPS
jgi:hypothetical protein